MPEKSPNQAPVLTAEQVSSGVAADLVQAEAAGQEKVDAAFAEYTAAGTATNALNRVVSRELKDRGVEVGYNEELTGHGAPTERALEASRVATNRTHGEWKEAKRGQATVRSGIRDVVRDNLGAFQEAAATDMAKATKGEKTVNWRSQPTGAELNQQSMDSDKRSLRD